MSDAEIIMKRGGIRPVARALQHRHHTTVQGWVERNSIPEEHRASVLALPEIGLNERAIALRNAQHVEALAPQAAA